MIFNQQQQEEIDNLVNLLRSWKGTDIIVKDASSKEGIQVSILGQFDKGLEKKATDGFFGVWEENHNRFGWVPIIQGQEN